MAALGVTYPSDLLTGGIGPFRNVGHDPTPLVFAGTLAPAPAQATTMTIQSLSGRTLVHPLYALVEGASSRWFAVCADLNLVGEGESDLDALNDLREQLGALFDFLEEHAATLGPVPASQLTFLRRLAGEPSR